jgi:hypothetical protein
MVTNKTTTQLKTIEDIRQGESEAAHEKTLTKT